MPLNPKVYVGSTEIKKAYFGSGLLFDRTSPNVSSVTSIPEVEAVFIADPVYLFTDAGTTNVTASGDAVQEWHSTDGLVVLSLVGSGVTYQESGGLTWVESNGSGRLSGTVPSVWSGDMLLAVAATDENGTQNTRPMTLADSTEVSVYHSLELNATAASSGVRSRNYAPPVGSRYDAESTYNTNASTAYVINAYIDVSTEVGVRINGSADEVATNNLDPGAAIWTGGGGDLDLTFCGEGGSSAETSANKIFGAVVAIGIPSAADRDIIDEWLASISGVTLDGVTP